MYGLNKQHTVEISELQKCLQGEEAFFLGSHSLFSPASSIYARLTELLPPAPQLTHTNASQRLLIQVFARE